jgi:hypothetical protein
MSWGWEDHFGYVEIEWIKVKGLWWDYSKAKVFVFIWGCLIMDEGLSFKWRNLKEVNILRECG